MNIIDERNVRTIFRKLKKKEYDDKITLSTASEEPVRLLDEGMVVSAAGTPDFYIMKGTLQAFYDALPDDYEGSVNLGHMKFATFPILLGKWTKKDMSLVDIGGGRKGIDVTLRLDEENFLVKELRRADYSLGVSAEFTYERDEAATEEFGLLMVNKLFIWDFAIVGEAGNVNSSGIQLKGEKMESKKILSLLNEGKSLGEINDLIDNALAEEGAEELTVTEDGEQADGTEAAKADLSDLSAEVDNLMEMIAALREENDALRSDLKVIKDEEAKFVNKFKNLKINLTNKTSEKTEKALFTDGFGG